MKKEEIVITENTILLGVFSTSNYNYFSSNKLIKTWKNFIHKLPSDNTNKFINPALYYVYPAAKICEKIIFLLDEIRFPIDTKASITCEELRIICENPDFYNKTVFVRGDNVINFDKNLVL